MTVSDTLAFQFLQRWPQIIEDFPGLDEPTHTAELLDQRDRDLEDFLIGVGRGHAIIDLGDGPILTGYTKSYLPLRQSRLSMVWGHVSVPPSTDIVAVVNKNGTPDVTLTIPAGD